MLVKLDSFDFVMPEKAANEPLKETRSVYWVKIIDIRNIIELNIPGSLGNMLQDLGREPVAILIAGEFVGPDAKASLEGLMSKYISENNKPMQFSSDMTTVIPEIRQVVLENFHFEELAARPDAYRYYLKLIEYKEPRPPPEEKTPEQEDTTETEIDDLRGQVLDSEGKPKADLKVKIKGPEKEFEATTDKDGYYEVLDVPEGKYEITVDDESYEDQKETVEVKKGDSKKKNQA